MARKAQAAMEFLMTYGWAILVVLVVLGALTYFGVLNPQTFMPSRCETGETWLKCKDYKLDSSGVGQVIITLENNWQYDVAVTHISVKSNVFDCAKDFTASILQGEEVQFIIDTCATVPPASRAGKGKLNSDITINWNRADTTGAVGHNMTGVLVAQIE